MTQIHQPLVEQYVLSSCLKDESLVDKTKDFFLSNIGKTIFKSLVSLREKSLPLTNSNIILECSSYGVSLTEEKISLIRELNTDDSSFEEYQTQLFRNFKKNELKSDQIKNLILEVEKDSVDYEKINDLLDDCKDSVAKIVNKKTSFQTVGTLLDDHKSVIVRRSRGDDYYPMGIKLLDKYNTIGYSPKYMTTIFGGSGSGKTTTACNLLNISLNRFIPSVYDTLELDKEFVIDKLISLRTGVPFTTLVNPNQEESDMVESILEIIEAEKKRIINSKRLVILEEVSQSISDLDYELPSIKKFMGVDYLVLHIDLCTMLQDFNKGGDNTATVYEKAVNSLHSLARKHNIHIVNYVQALRDQHGITVKSVEDLDKFRPRLNSIKNSSAFEERSRVVLGLFRPYYYAQRYLKEDPRVKLMTDMMEVQFLKQNMGELPTLEFFFKGDIGRIYPFKEAVYEIPPPKDDKE